MSYEIGIMIGAYIVTRMCELLVTRGTPKTMAAVVLTVCAVATLLAAAFIAFDLWVRGVSGGDVRTGL